MAEGVVRIRGERALFRYAVDTFVEALRQVSKNKRARYQCNDIDTHAWRSFVNHYGESVGKEFIRKFIEYGFQSWFNPSITTDHSRTIRFNWIFGAKGQQRWDVLGADGAVHVTRIGLKKDVDINLTKERSDLPELLKQIRPTEEKFKRMYYNTHRGLLWCVANTTLYHHLSPLCVGCKHKVVCKETLKNEMSKVYKIRGYGE